MLQPEEAQPGVVCVASPVGGLLLSAALTSMLTGITEPLEFTFLFVASLMYVVHCIYAGLSYMLMHILKVGVGMTFSGGLIDLTLFGILQGNARTHWIWIIVVGVVYFFLYYFTFRIMITKMNLATPGRESDDVEPKLFTRSDFKAKTGVGPDGANSGASDPVSAMIQQGLGGKKNISDVDCCATRLRITVVDESKAEGYPLTTPMIVCNTDAYTAVKPLTSGTVKNGSDLLSVQ